MLHYIDRMELPKWYDENVMMLMIVNPNTAYAYWELSFGQCRALSGWKPLLKLYRLSPQQNGNTEPQLVRTIALPPFTENWYFYDLKPQSSYRAELGWEQGGHYYTIIKSNCIILPPSDSLDTPGDVQWRRTTFERPDLKKQNMAPAKTLTEPKKMENTFETMPFYMGIKTISHPGKGS